MIGAHAIEQIRSVMEEARQPRFDPWKRDKTLRQSAKRRADGRWDNCGDQNGKAAAISYNARVALYNSAAEIKEIVISEANAIFAAAEKRKHRNELARKRRASKKEAA